MITAYQVFSESLLALCNARGSIADVCRATGINRQQFNKYLSGQVLPSRENLSKICAHFNIESQSLFLGKLSPQPVTGAAQNVQALINQDNARVNLAVGLYWLYSRPPFPGNPIIRLLLAVTNEGQGTKVRGLRRLGVAGKAQLGSKPIDLRGVLLQSGNRLSLLHRELNDLSRWGMINFQVNDVRNRVLLVGVAVSFRPDDRPFSSLVVVHKAAADIADWRQYYPQSGELPPNFEPESRLAEQAISMLQGAETVNLVFPEISEQLLRESRKLPHS